MIGKDPQFNDNDKDSKIIGAIHALMDKCEDSVSLVKENWKQNFDYFLKGSQFKDKAEWQADFSINKLGSSIRHTQGELLNILVQNPKWWALEPVAQNNPKASLLKKPLKKLMDYYMEDAKFKRHAGTFFLSSLTSMGALYVGWRKKLIQNPEFVLKQTEDAIRKEQLKLAKVVTNPEVNDPNFDAESLQEKLQSALESFQSEMVGAEPLKEPEAKPYVQIGALDFQDINPEDLWWDDTVQYMEDSQYKAFSFEKPLWEIKQWAKLGYCSRDKVAKIPPKKLTDAQAMQKWRYKTQTTVKNRTDVVELVAYYGPLIIDDIVKKDKYFCLIANGEVILKEGDYPYWEPPGHHTPVVNTAVRQIPFNATGAGIGDTAKKLQRTYDSNWHLVCDQFRYAIAGLNIVDYNKLIDKGALTSGIEPGKTLEVRGNPKEVFDHVNLSSNIENQVHPVQEMLRLAIEDATGINDAMTGAPNARSRTTAAETNARLGGAQRTVNTIALDLEQNFLIPVLQKIFARVLQFGISELRSNPELQRVLDESEMQELFALNEADKMEILNNYFKFKVSGFSSTQDKQEKLARVNELLQIANSGGPVSQLVNFTALIKLWTRLQELDDDEMLIISGSPLEIVTAENTALLTGHQIMPDEKDDDNFHIQNHQALLNSQAATQELQQHIMFHQQMMQQKQAMAQQAQQGQPGQEMQQGAQPPPNTPVQ